MSEAHPGEPGPDDQPRFQGDRYRVIGLLGQGGMGRVFSVYDATLGREVALKELLDVDAAHEARLLREARLNAELEHPGIVPVYDAGRTAEGRFFYTMRLIRGAPLRSLVGAADVGPAQRLRHVLEAARAVAFAHERGIIHRDLKPENMLVGALGETQVADWGIAVREADLAHEAGFSGTRRYAAPELLAGARASRASDVYALGLTLLELLLPAGAPLELAALGPSVPPALGSIIARAIATEPSRRYRDAAAFAQALADYLDGKLVPDHRYAPVELLTHFVRAWRTPLVAAGAALLLGLVGIVWRTVQLVGERDRAAAAEATATARTSELLLQRAHALALEGAVPEALEALAGCSDGPERRGLAMALLAGRQPRVQQRLARPECPRRLVARTGTLCLGPEGVRFEPDDDASTGARVNVEAAVATVTDDVLVLQTTSGRLQRYRLPALEPELDVDGANYAVAVGASAALTWAYNPGLLVFVDARGARTATASLCGALELAAAVPAGDRLSVFCADGSHRLVGPGAEPAASTAPVLTVPLRGLAAFSPLEAGAVLVATANGSLVEFPSGRHLAPLRLSGSVRGLTTVPTRAGLLVAVTTDRGVVTLVEPRSGQPLATLERATAGTLGVRAGALVSAGRSGLVVLGLDDVSAPVLRTAEGVVDLAAGDDRVVVGGGAGLWLDWRPGARQVTTLEPGTRGAIKGVGLAGTRALAAGVALLGVTWADPTTGQVQRGLAHRDMTMRGAGVLEGERLWLIGYGGGPWLVEGDGGLLGPDDGGTLERPGVPVWLHGSTLANAEGFVVVREDGLVQRRDAEGGVVDEVTVRGARRAVAASREAPLFVADAQRVHLPDGHALVPGAEVTALAVDGGGRWVAVGTIDGALFVYDARTTELLAKAVLHDERVSALAFSQDELVSGSWDRTVRRWSLEPLLDAR
ncbi:MAG: serine/threonine-protein kinase [Myxococcaceae bacterium]|nr:serine/threonine-protein kinase [Myxococcaceae bacterium]